VRGVQVGLPFLSELKMSSKMFELDALGRMDIPHFIRELQSEDKTKHQNVLAALCLAAHISEEHRREIANNADIAFTLTKHLRASSDCTGIVHNVALLIGHCCRSASEFRERLLQSGGLHRLVSLLDGKNDGDESGVLRNVSWALVQYMADAKCPVGECVRQCVERNLSRLLSTNDPKIVKNAMCLFFALQRIPKQSSNVSFRREKSMEAVTAMTELATVHNKTNVSLLNFTNANPAEASIYRVQSSEVQREPNYVQVCASTNSRHRKSVLSPWKRKALTNMSMLKHKEEFKPSGKAHPPVPLYSVMARGM